MKKTLIWLMIGAFLSLGANSALALGFGKNKFEKEVEKEQGAVKLAREAMAGGYELITTEELKKLIDANKDVLIIDTMPYEDSYKKSHIPGAKQFLFPIPLMETWDSKETGGKSQDDYAALLGDDKNKTIGNRSDPSHFFYAARGRGGTSSPWRRAVITSARYFHGQALRFL
ncbi:rhodanese-like domain-containing protein, partial [Candidatus Electrothrix sp.]|uniref:rhodanese-like domain-containing protein n=1 Tax=Candidatus Electrothrix sp. TaxID=2170559 RepID=UPI004057874D